MGRDQKTKRFAEQIERDASSDYATRPSGTTGNLVSIAASGDIADAAIAATDVNNAVQCDDTGRQLRQIQIDIEDGTNASTLKITLTSLINGDAVTAKDNIAKGATTSGFTLDAAGETLTIEATNLSGNCVMAQGVLASNASAVALTLDCYDSGSDIVIIARASSTGVAQDLTVLVDTGALKLNILYLTDA